MIENNSSSVFASEYSNNSLDHVTSGFKDEKVCGESKSCIVYRMCFDGLQVAVKRLKKDYVSQPGYVASYRKEFHIGQRLKHDALPIYRKLYADMERNGMKEVYIVMDYIDGISVEDFIKTKEGQEYFSSNDNIRRFLRELLNVVVYLHRNGVIHCDLKPANIMLRHSDRSVMLLDLDKAYCDTMDSTHGGTPLISDAIKATDGKPTAYKDFSAIGNILDIIKNNVTKYPSGRFKRFRQECLNKNTNWYRLTSVLDSKSYGKHWIIIAILCAVIAIPLVLLWNSNTHDTTKESSTRALEVNTDTINIISQPVVNPTSEETMALSSEDSATPVSVDRVNHSSQHNKLPESTSTKQEQPSEVSIDIDTPMAEFIAKVESAHSTLSSGITRQQLCDLLYTLVESRSPVYQSIIEDIKQKYPDKAGIDVELAVARAYEKSRAGKLYKKFNEAVSDTLRQWDKELDNDIK